MKRKANLGLRKPQWQQLILELLVVFLGVSAGFLLNNWRMAQAEKGLEKEYMAAFREDIRLNMIELQTGIAFDSTWLSDMQPIVADMATDQLLLDSATANVPRLLNLSRPALYTSTYEAIIGSGSLDIIKDFQLKSDLAQYHSDIEDLYSIAAYHLRYFQELIMPYIFDHYNLATREADEGFEESAQLSNSYVGFYSLVTQQLTAKRALLAKSKELKSRLEGEQAE